MLTSEQKAVLKADVLANQDTATLYNDGNLDGLADLYNANASPDFYIWRDQVTQDEIMQNGFNWVRVDNLSVGRARIWEWMFDNQQASIDARKENVRAGIAEVWQGTAADNAVRLAVFLRCQKLATRVEKLFATGAGTSVTVDGVGPAMPAFSGFVNYTDFIGL